ncbi:hypothetical protein Bhyg_07107 [Pseudolycoriella hygida]|uniref:Uncharacterized protein n=1 Tax=Pseudolycoriella hygida TaxID=35572 RepID=A0A9Q0S3I0_9DIPT|nr:hypothetical protein Bhyg_07107 [Pseudolycoriella hygida]
MFKLFAVSCILFVIVVVAAPAPGVLVHSAPVVHAAPLVAHPVAVAHHPVAVSHSSSHVVHHTAPVAKIVATPVVAHHIAPVHVAHPVHTHVVSAPLVKTVVPVVHHAPIVHHSPVITVHH